ncbi:hypothetical protein [Sphingomonas solaris]|uniref:Glycosyltransferase n=1 Tax=Alterirhizorhabdus solaris TaxID=2529389 RepID=A0A558QYB1_9SPHN|nr:hypothetical protein [Sphingomonas solaris]TVV72099.1 hypothetical protein FOY91_15345 [Sphingomonas solaris]
MTGDDGQQATVVDRRIELHHDPVPHRMNGWAAPDTSESAADAVTLTLMLGAVALGTVRRGVVRPDVQAHLGFAGPPCGFSLADYGLAAFARLSGLADIMIAAGGIGVTGGHFPLMPLPSAATGQPLGTRSRGGQALRLADLWFETRRDLAIRFEAAAAGLRLDAYQCPPDTGLVKVAANLPVGGPVAIATVRLLNPYLPVLIVLRDAGGGIGAIDHLPFPSLARGGPHAAERLMSARGGDEPAEIAALSGELLDTLLARPQPGTTVTTVELDGEVHTGLEPILDDDLLAWITGFLRIAVTLPADTTGDGRDVGFIRERLARHPVAARPGHALLVPADAIPTIAALVRRLPPGAGEQTIAGGMAVVDWSRHGSVWSVWTPPLGDWLEGLQTADAKRSVPLLRLAGAADAGAASAPDWPLALALRGKPVRMAAEGPFEIAAEVPLPLLREGAAIVGVPVTVAVLFDRDDTSPLALLESLARQEGCGALELIVCRPADTDDAVLRAALTAGFPHCTVVPIPAESGRLAQLVAVRAQLARETVLVVDAATVLTDPRTLATLAAMLVPPQVATAGCLLRTTHGPKTGACAGYVTTGLDLRVLPGLMVDTVDPAVFRQPATYPVVANPLGAVLLRRALLDGLDAHGNDPLRPEMDDLLLGLHAIGGGGLNLCTSTVSAHAPRVPRARQLTLAMPYRLSPQVLGGIMAGAVLVQRLR